MRRAAQLPTLSWHGRSSAVGLPPCSLPPQDLGRVLDGGPIRHGVDSQQLVVPGSPPLRVLESSKAANWYAAQQERFGGAGCRRLYCTQLLPCRHMTCCS